LRKPLRLAFCPLLLALILQAAVHAEPQDEPPAAPPTVAEEVERLKTLKKAEFEKLKIVVFGDSSYKDKLTALRKIADLATPEAVGLLGTLYDNPISEAEDNKLKERLLIVKLIAKIGSPAGASILLKAVQNPGKDGKIRETGARALARVMGKQAIPHLKKLTEDKVEAVKNRAWLELLKMRDIGAMRHVFKLLEGKKKLAALDMIKEAHFTEAAEDVAKLAKETDFSSGKGGPNEKILKLKALETALDLGHKESVAVTIELLGSITREQAKVLEVISPERLLGRYTRKDFKNRKEWEEWWKKEGKDIPLFSGYIDTTDLKGMGAAIVEYYRGEKFDPIAKSSIIYFEDSPFARAVESPDGSNRKYSACALALLGVDHFGKPYNFRSNGLEAFISFFRVQGTESGHNFWLKKVNGKWKFHAVGGMR
jgi:hypothetical protein